MERPVLISFNTESALGSSAPALLEKQRGAGGGEQYDFPLGIISPGGGDAKRLISGG
jgi:hypothetical protein